MKKIIYLILTLISSFMLFGCNNGIDTYTITFDEVFSVVPYAKVQMTKKEYKEKYNQIVNDVNQRLQAIDQTFNPYLDTSLISKINNHDSISSVSSEFMTVLNEAIAMSEICDKYDITIFPIFTYWDFNNRYYGRTNQAYDINEIINQDELNELIALVDYKNIIYDNTSSDSVYLSKIGAKIDLGSIAKGYACDCVKEELMRLGVNSGIVDIGGNIITFGKPIKNGVESSWNVGIKKPYSVNDYVLYVKSDKVQTFVTSGIYERYILGTDGIKYHHILDPKTGYPVDTDIVSVTIFGEISSMKADALSTVLICMGYDLAMDYVNANNINCIIIKDDNSIHLSNSVDVNNIVYK